jgi:phospholipid transport system substrate-binding protein
MTTIETKSLLFGAARSVVAMLAMFVASASAYAADLTAQSGPGELIESVAREVVKELDAHRTEMRKDPQKIRKLVDEYLLPHFDTEYAAKLVLGKNWRTATADQRKRFVEAFYQSLLQNYGEALLEFTPDRLTIQPYRGAPAETTATIRTEVKRDNGTRVPVNYSLHKIDSGWKAYDVTIEGISYIKSFRTDFGAEIDQKGLDGVIQRLETQQGTNSKSAKDAGSKAASK